MSAHQGVCSAAEALYRKQPSAEGASKIWVSWAAYIEKADELGGQSAINETGRKYYRNRRNNRREMSACINGCFQGEEMAFFASLLAFPSYQGKVYKCTHNTGS